MLIACSACAQQETPSMTQQTFSDPVTAQLAQAAKSGDAARIRELVAGGANPNAQGDNGTTMLQWAMLQQSRTGFERSEEHTSELQSLMRIPYAVFCLKKKQQTKQILN